MRVTVTDVHIEEGTRGDGNYCAIAQATKDLGVMRANMGVNSDEYGCFGQSD